MGIRTTTTTEVYDLETPPGLDIRSAARGAMLLATLWEQQVSFLFNDIIVNANPTDRINEILKEYDRKQAVSDD